jgi:hypothetical protein
MARRLLFWYAPRWSYASQMRRSFKDFKRSVCWRRVAWIGVTLGLITFGVIWWAKDEPTYPTLSELIGFGLIIALTALITWAAVWIPPSMLVTRSFVWKDDPGIFLKRKDIVSAQLILHSGDRNRLKVRVKSTKAGRTLSMVFSIGIPRRIDLEELAEMLPVRPVVKEARGRRIGAVGAYEEQGSTGRDW